MPDAPRITPLDATLGAVVEDVRLRSLDDGTWATIEAAFLRHALLIFPGQHLTDAEQTAFASRFGPIERIVAGADTIPISNRFRDGTPLAADHYSTRIQQGNEGWHTDSSYMPLAAKASVLSARVVPSAGGGTEWADMRAAHDALDPATRERIAGLSAHHSIYHSQAQIGHEVESGAGYGFHDEGAPLRPLVKVHPETGRSALFIGRHAHSIPGWSPGASQALLAELLDGACRPPRTHEHRWAPGDVVVWDNRCVLHRARPYDRSEGRTMHHTRISGDPASELAPTSPTVR
ncbi:MAG: TauD/TfdA family dioxygenase [Actinomycetota bacterium]